jgi:transposase
MTRPISNDLRERVVGAFERGEGTYLELAERFGVGAASVSRWLRIKRERGDVSPLRHKSGRRPTFDEEGLKELRRLVEEQPDATLAELSARYAELRGVVVALNIICRALQRLELRRKKRPSMRRSNSAPTSS